MSGGGSILTVPVLVYLIGVNPVLSTAYSLFIVGSTSLVRATGYARKGLVSAPTALVFLATSLAAVFMTRKFLLPAIPHELFTVGRIVFTKDLLVLVTFAILMVATATSMIRSRQAEEMLEDDGKHQHRVNYVLILTVGAIVGLLTGFVGAGGGVLIIPALVLFARLPMKLAVGTSLTIITPDSLTSFTGDLSAGRVMNWPLLTNFSGLCPQRHRAGHLPDPLHSGGQTQARIRLVHDDGGRDYPDQGAAVPLRYHTSCQLS